MTVSLYVVHIVCLSLSWNLMIFWAKYPLRSVLFVILVGKPVSKFAGIAVEITIVHQSICYLEPFLLGSLKSIYLLQYQIYCRAVLISVWHEKEISHSLQKISPRTLFSYIKALKVQSLFHSSLNEMKAWILYKIDLLHAISCCKRGNIGLQTSFEEFQICQCATSFKLIHFVFPAFFNFSIIANVKAGSFSVVQGKLSGFNNIGSLTGTLHVTSLSVQNVLNCSSHNFDILEISSYTISLKVNFYCWALSIYLTWMDSLDWMFLT